MKNLDMEPGFQAPCRKAHLSLLYGNLAENSKEEARTIVRRDFGKDIFENSFPMKTVELWKTGGGLEGIPKWSHVAAVCLQKTIMSGIYKFKNRHISRMKGLYLFDDDYVCDKRGLKIIYTR